ncbi:hypothetical protein [Gemmiger qucibialis]|jgi:hypothetical protein|uniref:hypothetical protein n=1 Tax=Gemmiger qucibialis TaxID=2997294 RepID=UPI0022E2D35F|nr:hypothetical protein [Gemmiger qucibialis]
MLDKTSSIICAFGLAAAAPRSPYRHLELCGIALTQIHNAPGGHGQEERAVPALFESEVFFRERSNFHLGTEKVHEQR